MNSTKLPISDNSTQIAIRKLTLRRSSFVQTSRWSDGRKNRKGFQAKLMYTKDLQTSNTVRRSVLPTHLIFTSTQWILWGIGMELVKKNVLLKTRLWPRSYGTLLTKLWRVKKQNTSTPCQVIHVFPSAGLSFISFLSVSTNTWLRTEAFTLKDVRCSPCDHTLIALIIAKVSENYICRARWFAS